MWPCIRKRPAPDWLVPVGLYRATGARNVWTSKSSTQNCVSCLSFLYVPQCSAAGVRRRSSGQRVAADTWIPRYARSHTGRCKFHPRVARAQFFIVAQGHLVPKASIFFRHAGVGRKWPDGLYQPWWAHQAVKDVMEFGSRYGVPIRLVDVVGERYQWRWFSFASNSIYKATSKKIIKKISRCCEVKSGVLINTIILSSKGVSCPHHRLGSKVR